MGQVTDAWVDIERWMTRWAPASAALLAGPADPDEIAAAQRRLGFAFPDDLVESLRRHNGLTRWDNLFPGQPPLSVARIVEHHEMCVEIQEDLGEDEDDVPDGEPWWHRLWVPFAEIDGDSQIIDLRPGPGYGRLGWAQHDDSGSFHDAWPNLGAYLAATASALLAGTGTSVYADGAQTWVPYLTVRDTLWWSSAGTTELNGQPLRRAPAGLS